MNLAAETSAIRWGRLLTSLTLLMPGILTSQRSTSSLQTDFAALATLPYHHPIEIRAIRSFGSRLEPR